jgi:hypothetical protein
LAVRVFERANEECVVMPATPERALAGKSTRGSDSFEATISPIEARRSSVAIVVQEGIGSRDAWMRRMMSALQARDEQPNPMERCSCWIMSVMA